MGEQRDVCLSELRTLFLFEALTDEQLQILCENGHIQTFEPGPVVIEGEPATCFYVLIDGELVMSNGRAAWTSRPAAPRSAACTAAHGRRTYRARKASTRRRCA